MKQLLFLLTTALSLLSFDLSAQNEFITTWKTTADGESITIPTNSTTYSYNYSVDWGDGSGLQTGITGNASHAYASAGTYTVKISGAFPHIYFNNSGDKDKIKTIEQWGNIQWESMSSAFYGCTNLTYNATDIPDLTNVTTFFQIFKDCFVFNGNINNWDVSTITDMASAFMGARDFNQPLNNWNVSNVTRTSLMFRVASRFNQPLDNWDVSKVTDMSGMFYFAHAFNQPLNSWNTSAVTNMSSMFGYDYAFNQDISSWDVSSVTNMISMFNNAHAFNQDISGWDVSSVTNMSSMFKNARAFNQDISGWNVGNVSPMTTMFNGASSFNQNLGAWNVSNVYIMTDMFNGSALSTANYDNTLIGWANLPSLRYGVTLGASNVYYCNAETARNTLINTRGWTFNDAGKKCPPTDITLSSTTINENNAIGDVVGSFSTADADVGDTHTYSLVSGSGDTDNGSFMITGSNLEAGAVFDFETKASYSIRVRTTDATGATFEKAFTITINAAPTFTSTPVTSATEDVPYSYSVAASDANGDNLTISADAIPSWLTHTDNGDGTATLSGTPANSDVGDHMVTIKVSDSGGASDTQNFTVTVINTNDQPTDIVLISNNIDENNTIGDVVGTFSTTDPDAGDTHSYALVAGTGDTDNASFTISGNNLEAGEVFDFEVKSSYSIRVQTNDGNGGTFEESYTITINDVSESTNSAPTAISISSSIIDENNAIGDVIGSFSTTDADAGDTHSYALVAGTGDTDNSSFTINGTDLVAGEVFDFETKSSYSIRVQTNDGNGGTFEEAFTITINDVTESTNSAPTAISISSSIVDENNAIGDVIGSFSTTDADATDTHTYALVTGAGDTDNASFTITSGNLEAGEVFDFETKSSYSIRVQTNDGNGGTFDDTFTITINDVNEQQAQTITFDPIADQFLEKGSITLTAMASSGLTVEYTITAGPATVAGDVITFTGVGTVTVEAAQPGNENYLAVAPVSQTFEVVTVTATLPELEETKLSVYPNPATEVLHLTNIQSNVQLLQVTDITGQVVEVIENPDTNETVEVNNWKDGVYFILMNGPDSQQTIKFIKQ